MAPPSPLALPPSPASDAPITIVSGLPRSGTSMVMQMLAAGGMSLVTDGQRAADEHNQRGYLEYEPVKNLRADNSWLGAACGKAVKVIVQLLPALPMTHRYRIVYVERDIDEVLASQRLMLGGKGLSAIGRRPSANQLKPKVDEGAADAQHSTFNQSSEADSRQLTADSRPRISDDQLRRTFTTQAKQIRGWLARQPQVELLAVDHRQVLADPEAAAREIATFLGNELDTAQMATAVDPALYRTRC